MSAASFTHGSPLQTLIVWVLGACVAAVVWYAVFYRDARDEWEVASNDLAVAEKSREKVDAKRRQLAALRTDLDREAQTLASERAALPGGDGRAEDLLMHLPALAAEVGLTIDRWRPLPDELAAPLLRAPVQVDARGSWAAFGELLRRVDQAAQVVAVEQLTVRVGAGDELELGFVVRVSRLQEAPP